MGRFSRVDKMASMNPKDHPLFKQYPIKGTAQISCGEVPTPYHIYDGYGLFIGGACDLSAARHLLKDEDLNLIETTDNKTPTGIWICNFTDASLNPHHELQFSFFSSKQREKPTAPHPFNTLSIMLTHPDVQMLCHGLWNNTPLVVAYNRELLSLNARLTESKIEHASNSVNFSFKDSITGNSILSGSVRNPQRNSLLANLSFLSKIGFRRGSEIAKQPWTGMQVLNPKGVVLDRNATAKAFNKSDVNVVRYFDGQTSSLEFGNTPYRPLQFSASFSQYMSGFKFVYLEPE